MKKKFSYVTDLDIRFDNFQVIDIPNLVRQNKEKWFNQSLTLVNCSVNSNVNG